MTRSKTLAVVSAVAMLVATFAVPTDAEARRYRRGVVRGPVIYSPPVVVRRAPAVYRSGYRAPYASYGRYGYGYGGFGGVRVGAPGVGVYVGW